MTIHELVNQTKNQVSLLNKLANTLYDDVKNYPNETCDLTSLVKLEHVFNSLLTLNDSIVKEKT